MCVCLCLCVRVCARVWNQWCIALLGVSVCVWPVPVFMCVRVSARVRNQWCIALLGECVCVRGCVCMCVCVCSVGGARACLHKQVTPSSRVC